MTTVAQRHRPTATQPEVAAVADNLVQLMRTFTKQKARLMAATAGDVDWSAHMVLRCLQHDGPMRAGAVAEALQSDPSTVSRQVAGLVKDGYLERRADPEDGRASILVLTGKADELLAAHDRLRLEFFAETLDGWSDTDMRRFATLLQRFTEAYEAANATFITERIATRSVRAGSTD